MSISSEDLNRVEKAWRVLWPEGMPVAAYEIAIGLLRLVRTEGEETQGSGSAVRQQVVRQPVIRRIPARPAPRKHREHPDAVEIPADKTHWNAQEIAQLTGLHVVTVYGDMKKGRLLVGQQPDLPGKTATTEDLRSWLTSRGIACGAVVAGESETEAKGYFIRKRAADSSEGA